MASGRAFEQFEIQVQPDLHLLLFTIAIVLLTALLFGWRRHGTTAMTHVAIQEKLDGKVVDWMVPVSDEHDRR